MEQGQVIALALGILLAACLWLLFLFIRTIVRVKKERLALARIVEKLHAERTPRGYQVIDESFSFEFILKHRIPGFFYRCMTGRSGGAWLEVSTGFMPGVRFTLRRRRRIYDLFWTRSNPASLIQSGDAEFDADFLVVSSDAAFADEFLSFDRRRSVRTLLLAGFDILLARDGRLSLVRKIRSPEELSSALVCTAATELQVLSRNITPVENPKAIPAHTGLWRRATLLSFLFLAFSLYLFLAFDLLDPDEALLISFIAALPLAFIALWFGAPVLLSIYPGDEASARRRPTTVYAALVFLLSVGLFGAVIAVNCGLDQSPQRIVTSLILGKDETNARGFLPLLALRSWRGNAWEEWVRIRSADVSAGDPFFDCASLFLRDGALGLPWVESYAVVSGQFDLTCNAERSAVMESMGASTEDQEGEQEAAEPPAVPAVYAAMNLTTGQEKQLEAEPLHERFESYYSELMQHILAKWTWTSSDRKLTASYEAKLTSKGRLQGLKRIQSSGDADFDTSSLDALQKAQPLPPPGRDLVRFFEEMRITFDSQLRINEEEPAAHEKEDAQ